MSGITGTLQLVLLIVQWVGSIFGLIGGIILIIRFFKERPILKTNVYSHHGVIEDNTYFYIELDIDNIGDKPTTIKDIFFLIPDSQENDSWNLGKFENFKMFHLNPQSSTKFSEEFIVEDLVEGDVEIEMYLDHTHGSNTTKIESIFLPDDEPDEED